MTFSRCALALLVSFHSAGPPQQPTFSSEIETVRIDVSVRQGRQALRGLTAADFEVLDNGVRQQAG